jgi:hypothetical protein
LIEVVWTPPTAGALEPYFKAYDQDGRVIRPFYAYHRDEVGRRYYRVPDSEKNRDLAMTRGKDWALLSAKPEITEDAKRVKVCEILTSLGIQHRSNVKLETLIHKLPVGMRSGFLE